MRREEAEKLLGGYASGTLTAAEREALFSAALEDQALFDALADEEALRETLSDPRCRRRVLEALAPAPAESAWAWLGKQWRWAAAGSLAAGLALVVVLVSVDRQQPEPAAPAQVARLEQRQPAAAMTAPAPQPRKGVETVEGKSKTAPPRRNLVMPRTAPEREMRLTEAPPMAPAEQAAASAPHATDALKKAEEKAAAPPPPPPAPAAQVAAESSEMRARYSGFRKDRAADEPARAMGAGGGAMRATAVASRYEILRRDESGRFVKAAPDAVFHRGEQLKLEVAPAQRAYVYVITGLNNVATGFLYPGQSQTFSIPTGETRVRVIASPTPLSNVQAPPPTAELRDITVRYEH